jgi:uncharacterized membrane protein YwzB
MDPNIIRLVIIIVVACLLYWANNALNTVPLLKRVIQVAIVVISVLMCIQPSLNLLTSGQGFG